MHAAKGLLINLFLDFSLLLLGHIHSISRNVGFYVFFAIADKRKRSAIIVVIQKQFLSDSI